MYDTSDYDYVCGQIMQAFRDGGSDRYRVKITGDKGETKWLTVSADTARELAGVLSRRARDGVR